MSFFIFIIIVISILIYLDNKPKKSSTRSHTKRTRYKDKPLDDENNLFIFLSNKKGYLQSNVWQGKRKAVLKRDNYTCQCCGVTGIPLEVHHLRDYNKLGNEPLSSLISVCRPCHELQHQTLGYPQTFKQYMEWNVPLIKRN